MIPQDTLQAIYQSPDTIQMVTHIVTGIDTCGEPYAVAIKSHPIVKELSDGISPIYFLFGFAGGLLHMLLKLVYNYNQCQELKQDFYLANWIRKNMLWAAFSVVFGLVSVYFTEAMADPLPLRAWMCIGSGMVGGLFAFYLFPVMLNKDFWLSIVRFTPFGRFLPKV